MDSLLNKGLLHTLRHNSPYHLSMIVNHSLYLFLFFLVLGFGFRGRKLIFENYKISNGTEEEMIGCVSFSKYLPFIYPSQMNKMKGPEQ